MKDDIGSFFIVTKATSESVIEDIFFVADISDIIFHTLGGLREEDILLISKDYDKAYERATKELYENRKLD